MSDALADALRAALAEQFPDRGIEFRTGTAYGLGTHVAHIPCPSGTAGDIDIHIEEEPYPEVTLSFGEPTWSHTHLAQYDADYPDVIEWCCFYLTEVFADHVVIWCGTDASGGLAPAEDAAAIERWSKIKVPGLYMATWSRVVRDERP